MKKSACALRIAASVSTILLPAVLPTALAQAQTRVSETKGGASHAAVLKPRFRLQLEPISVSRIASTNINGNGEAFLNVALIPTPSGANQAVIGSGTLGHLAKWSGLTNSNSVIGDSSIYEDKFGNVGIGTETPTARLTVIGTIQASGGTSILRDSTLTGNGTSPSPLGVAVPLFLNGQGEAILSVVNRTASGDGVFSFGGNGNASSGGSGVVGVGGNSQSGNAGAGLTGKGGGSFVGEGGTGVLGSGGDSAFGDGGVGLRASGGTGGKGGNGLIASGGAASGSGHIAGTGIVAQKGAGLDGASDGLAGDFDGDVKVSGTVKLGIDAQLFAPGGEENLRVIRGAVDTTGNITLGAGFSIQPIDVGEYKIKFNTPFSATPVVTISPDLGFAHVTCSGIECSVLLLDTTPKPASLAFTFIAAGPR